MHFYGPSHNGTKSNVAEAEARPTATEEIVSGPPLHPELEVP